MLLLSHEQILKGNNKQVLSNVRILYNDSIMNDSISMNNDSITSDNSIMDNDSITSDNSTRHTVVAIALAVGLIMQLIGTMVAGFLWKDQTNNKSALMVNVILMPIITIAWVVLGIMTFTCQAPQLGWVHSNVGPISYGLFAFAFVGLSALVTLTTLMPARVNANAANKARIDSAVVFQLCSLIAPIIILIAMWACIKKSAPLYSDEIVAPDVQEQLKNICVGLEPKPGQSAVESLKKVRVCKDKLIKVMTNNFGKLNETQQDALKEMNKRLDLGIKLLSTNDFAKYADQHPEDPNVIEQVRQIRDTLSVAQGIPSALKIKSMSEIAKTDVSDFIFDKCKLVEVPPKWEEFMKALQTDPNNIDPVEFSAEIAFKEANGWEYVKIGDTGKYVPVACKTIVAQNVRIPYNINDKRPIAAVSDAYAEMMTNPTEENVRQYEYSLVDLKPSLPVSPTQPVQVETFVRNIPKIDNQVAPENQMSWQENVRVASLRGQAPLSPRALAAQNLQDQIILGGYARGQAPLSPRALAAQNVQDQVSSPVPLPRD